MPFVGFLGSNYTRRANKSRLVRVDVNCTSGCQTRKHPRLFPSLPPPLRTIMEPVSNRKSRIPINGACRDASTGNNKEFVKHYYYLFLFEIERVIISIGLKFVYTKCYKYLRSTTNQSKQNGHIDISLHTDTKILSFNAFWKSAGIRCEKRATANHSSEILQFRIN